MQKTYKIAGPPGTGKTTTLLNTVSSLLQQGVPASRILYTTFTRAGAYEARDRAQEKFSLSDADLQYFKTLHALCLRNIGITGKLMTASDWVTLGKRAGIWFTVKRQENDNASANTKGDHMLACLGLARNFQYTLEEAFRVYPDNHRFRMLELEHLNASLNAYKEETGRVDYTDLLERYIKTGTPLNVTHAIGDEMQDLTPLQWQVFRKMTEAAEHVWIAGDDDQCLYEWAGASAELFIDSPGELTVLGQSYRIPAKVHEIAERVAGRMQKRLPKTYLPREEPGVVSLNTHLDKLPLDQGSWLLLVRNVSFGEILAGECLRRGLRYTTNIAFPGNTSKTVDAVSCWKRLEAGLSLSGKEVKNMGGVMQRGAVEYGYKEAWNGINDMDTLDMASLVESYGLLPTKDWRDTFNVFGIELALVNSLEASGQLLTPPRIEISTIHGAKGREAQNIGLCVDQSKRTKEAQIACADPEHRVWYVAVTRAKEALYVIEPLTQTFYEI